MSVLLDAPTIPNVAPNLVLREGAGGDDAPYFRVLHVDPDAGIAWIMAMEGRWAWPAAMCASALENEIADGTFLVVPDPRPATMRRDSELSQAEIEKRDERFGVIRPIVGDPGMPYLVKQELQRAVARRIAELVATGAKGLRGDKVAQLVLCYLRGGRVQNALVPAYSLSGGRGRVRPGSADGPKRGRPRHGLGRADVAVGLNVTPEVLGKLLASAPFLRRAGTTDRAAYELCLDRHFSDQTITDGILTAKHWPPDRLPSLGQFLYHAKPAVSAEARMRGRVGDTAYDQRIRSRTGSAAGLSFGPGSTFQVDATLADLMLAMFDDARAGHADQALVGKPYLYLVVDVYSGMIVGFSVSLRPPSFETYAWAVANACEDKVAYCASLGIEIVAAQWPSRTLAPSIVGDRGSEVTSRFNSVATAALDVASLTLPRARPDYKGLVEGRFAFLDENALKYAPGTWRRRLRGERPNPLDGAMTMLQFEKFMVRQIIKHNTTRGVRRPPPDWDGALGREPTPAELWRHGCAARGQPETADMRRILAGLMHSDTARETDRGLRFKGLHYLPDDPASPLHARFHRTSRFKDVEVRYNPAVASRLFVPTDGGERLLPCSLGPGPNERRFAESRCTFDEVQLWFAAQRADAHGSEPGRRAAAAAQDARIAAETASAWQAGPKGNRSPKHDPEARRAEGRAQRVGKAAEVLRAAGVDPDPAQAVRPDRAPVAAPAPFRVSRLSVISAVTTDHPAPSEGGSP